MVRHTLCYGLVLLASLHCVLPPVGGKTTPDTTPIMATTYQLFVPFVRKAECRYHTASMTQSATATTLQVGEVVRVTARLHNHGCVALGLPQYTLWWESAEPLFNPISPLQVVHYLAVAPGQCDEAQFMLRAVRSGRATLRVNTSFEVHLGYPGPAYWGGCSAPPLELSVTP